MGKSEYTPGRPLRFGELNANPRAAFWGQARMRIINSLPISDDLKSAILNRTLAFHDGTLVTTRRCGGVDYVTVQPPTLAPTPKPVVTPGAGGYFFGLTVYNAVGAEMGMIIVPLSALTEDGNVPDAAVVFYPKAQFAGGVIPAEKYFTIAGTSTTPVLHTDQGALYEIQGNYDSLYGNSRLGDSSGTTTTETTIVTPETIIYESDGGLLYQFMIVGLPYDFNPTWRPTYWTETFVRLVSGRKQVSSLGAGGYDLPAVDLVGWTYALTDTMNKTEHYHDKTGWVIPGFMGDTPGDLHFIPGSVDARGYTGGTWTKTSTLLGGITREQYVTRRTPSAVEQAATTTPLVGPVYRVVEDRWVKDGWLLSTNIVTPTAELYANEIYQYVDTANQLFMYSPHGYVAEGRHCFLYAEASYNAVGSSAYPAVLTTDYYYEASPGVWRLKSTVTKYPSLYNPRSLDLPLLGYSESGAVKFGLQFNGTYYSIDDSYDYSLLTQRTTFSSNTNHYTIQNVDYGSYAVRSHTVAEPVSPLRYYEVGWVSPTGVLKWRVTTAGDGVLIGAPVVKTDETVGKLYVSYTTQLPRLLELRAA